MKSYSLTLHCRLSLETESMCSLFNLILKKTLLTLHSHLVDFLKDFINLFLKREDFKPAKMRRRPLQCYGTVGQLVCWTGMVCGVST